VVKLLDLGAGRVLDTLTMAAGDSEPWDLTLRKPGTLAVTYPKVSMDNVSRSRSLFVYSVG
jgi:hypothetical protein